MDGSGRVQQLLGGKAMSYPKKCSVLATGTKSQELNTISNNPNLNESMNNALYCSCIANCHKLLPSPS